MSLDEKLVHDAGNMVVSCKVRLRETIKRQ
jgi:hypothetical protein